MGFRVMLAARDAWWVTQRFAKSHCCLLCLIGFLTPQTFNGQKPGWLAISGKLSLDILGRSTLKLGTKPQTIADALLQKVGVTKAQQKPQAGAARNKMSASNMNLKFRINPQAVCGLCHHTLRQ